MLALSAIVLVSVRPSGAWAQSAGAGAQQGAGAEEASGRDRWRLRAGPFVIAPYVRVGEIALDTNVFYTAEDRTTDLAANGGPGLRIDVPIGRVVPYVDANANYYWFARTEGQRRFGGAVGGGFDWKAGAFRLGASRYFERTYQRPSIEVDQRVLRDEWRTTVGLAVDAGARLRIEPALSLENRVVPRGSLYLGTDLSEALTEDRYRAEVALKYGVTSKTFLVALADQEWSRFPNARTRDVDSNRLGGGFELTSETRLRGQAVGGIRLFRPKSAVRGERFTRPFATASLEWILGAKTRLGADYSIDTTYSAFDTQSTALPTIDMERVGVRFFRQLLRRIDFLADGSLTTLKNNAPVVIRRRSGEETVVRDDRFYSARADLGFRILERLRLGATVSYNERQSNFADFGVDGLLLGASLRFNP